MMDVTTYGPLTAVADHFEARGPFEPAFSRLKLTDSRDATITLYLTTASTAEAIAALINADAPAKKEAA